MFKPSSIRPLIILLSGLLLWQMWLWAVNVQGGISISVTSTHPQSHSFHHIDRLHEYGQILPHHHASSHKHDLIDIQLANTYSTETTATSTALISTSDTNVESHCCHVQGSTVFTLIAEHIYLPPTITTQPPVLLLTQYYPPFLASLYRPPIMT